MFSNADQLPQTDIPVTPEPQSPTEPQPSLVRRVGSSLLLTAGFMQGMQAPTPGANLDRPAFYWRKRDEEGGPEVGAAEHNNGRSTYTIRASRLVSNSAEPTIQKRQAGVKKPSDLDKLHSRLPVRPDVEQPAYKTGTRARRWAQH